MRFSRFVAVLLLAPCLLTLPVVGQTKDKGKGEEPPSYIGGKTLKQWIADFKSPDASVRQQAIRTVVNFGPYAKEAVPGLLQLASRAEPDTSLRGDAAAALGMIGSHEGGIALEDMPRVIQTLTGLLTTNESQVTVRLQATLALANLGSRARSAVPMIADNATSSNSWELRKAVCFALGRVGSDPVKGPDSKALATVIGRLNDPCSPVRLEAILALSALGLSRNPAEVDYEKKRLEALLKDPDKNIAIWARTLLMFIDDRLVNEKNLTELSLILHKDPDPKIRTAAARALGTLGSRAKSQIPDLITALRDKDLDVILTSITALGMMAEVSPTTVIPEMEALLKDNEVAVKLHTIRVVGNLGKTARPVVPKLIPLLAEKDRNVVFTTINSLGTLGVEAETALPALRSLEKTHRDEEVQKAAGDAAKYISDELTKKKK